MIFRDTNSGRIISGQTLSGRVMRDLLASENFQITENPQTLVVVEGTTGSSTVKDAHLNTFTGATLWNYNHLPASIPLAGRATGPASYSSSNTAVATVDGEGALTAISAGDTTITVAVPGLGTKKYDNPVVSAGGQTTATWNSFVSGSLGNYLTANINSLISGKTPPSFSGSPPYAWNANINLFNTNGTRNTSGWWGATDVTCIPRNVATNGVLIAPDTALEAAHFGASPATYVGASGTVYNCTVKSSRTITSPVGAGDDLLVVTYNETLPSDVTPATILPANFRSYLPQPQYGYPCAFTNQDRTLLIGAVDSESEPVIAVVAPLNPTQSGWFYQIRNLDSASPAGLLIGGKFCLMAQWYFIEAGPIDSDNISQINAAIAANGSPYSVTTTDLSAYSTY